MRNNEQLYAVFVVAEVVVTERNLFPDCKNNISIVKSKILLIFKFFCNIYNLNRNIYKLLILLLLRFILFLYKLSALLILIINKGQIMGEDARFFGKSRLTKQGQLTLPKEARTKLGIDDKSELFWYEFNNALVVFKELINPKELANIIMKKRKKQ